MAEETKKSKQEIVKEASNFLRGTIAEDLARDTQRFGSDDAGLLKFHGTYQQDDRNARKHRKPGDDKSYIFMVRIKVPGGKLMADQFLTTLSLGEHWATHFASPPVRDFNCTASSSEIYGKPSTRSTSALLTTLAACGDVERNVMCCPAPHHNDGVHDRLQATADAIARHLARRPARIVEIWIDGEKADEQSTGPDIEPIYGNAYLPRKFKTGIALPEDNCIDVYTQDIVLLAVVEAGQLIGYNVLGAAGWAPHPATRTRSPPRRPMAFVP